MIVVNVHEAKTQLSRLLERVQKGEAIIIAKRGEPIARLVPIQRPRSDRVPGSARGGTSLIAQAQIENLPILTDDEQIRHYPVEVIW